MKWYRVFGIAGLAVLVIFSIYPQLRLQYLRGEEWNGTFATCDLDEMAYASYLQALIDGRPRRNDPYTGRDSDNAGNQPETLFSVQFFSAYIVAAFAKPLGLSASQIMPFVSAFSMLFTALMAFWLIKSLSVDERIAIVGALAVIVCSAVIVDLGAIGAFKEGGVAYPFFPFMRRYIPSVAFPFFFAFFACVWNGVRAKEFKKRIGFSTGAVFCFIALVFSYFYLWTAAAAFLACLTLLIFIFRQEGWKQELSFLFATGLASMVCLIPYAWLLSNRSEGMDDAQLLVKTRQPDLLRQPEIIAYFVIMAITFILWRKIAGENWKKLYFIAALALSVFVVFNQQVITNHSLQPFHYEYYVINYVVTLSVVLLAGVIWEKYITSRNLIANILFGVLMTGGLLWGYVEASETTKFWDDINRARDEAMQPNSRLRQIAAESGMGAMGSREQVTLNLDAIQADSQPTIAPQAVLWARHQHVFGGLRSREENKKRYYQFLYYSDKDENDLRSMLEGCANIETCMALFSWDRFNPTLSVNARPLLKSEIEEELARYSNYIKKHNEADASEPLISFVVIPVNSSYSLQNFDKWYERDGGEQVGNYLIYRTRLRSK